MQAEQQPGHTDETDEEFNEWNQQYDQSQNEESGNKNKPHDWQSLGETALDDFLTTNHKKARKKNLTKRPAATALCQKVSVMHETTKSIKHKKEPTLKSKN